jgi:predicted DCC family thiol-disulfide oxidoreductase YuxK
MIMTTKFQPARRQFGRMVLPVVIIAIASVTVVDSFGIQHQQPHPFRTVSRLGMSAITDSTTTTATSTPTLETEVLSPTLPDNYTTSSTSTSAPPRSMKSYDHPIILFDGVCNFCNTWVDILLRIDTKGVYKLTPLQSKLGQSLLQSIGKDADDISSIVLVETDGKTYYTKSDCVLQVVSQLGLPFELAMNVLKFTIPPFIRDTIYDTVSENRYSLLGQRDVCRSGDPIYNDRFISE